MLLLILVTIIWGFSFGLIKGNLAGVDSYFVSLIRMSLSLLIFLPYLRIRNLPRRMAWRIILTGGIQFGVMYIAYFFAFRYLKAYEVALFTIFTPLFVTLINDALERQFHPLFLVTAMLAVAGTAIVSWQDLASPELLRGFLLVQVSNLAFAFGQVAYRRLMSELSGYKDKELFGLLYLGAVVLTALASALFTDWQSLKLGATQYWTLAYLGIIASGLCFFFWNKGARQVNPGVLAIFNDLKVPLAVAISLLFFGERANLAHLLTGGVMVIAALVLNEMMLKQQTSKE